ncbi:MAG: adenosylmethionine decarboxylase, partial [Candidatus Hodarchaeales archaeon]
PYTQPGANLFFQRGREALKSRSNKIYLSFGAKEPNIMWNLQLTCLNAGFQLWEIHRGFNRYIGNLKLGQFSHLYIFKAIQQPSHTARYYPLSFTGKLYTAEMKRKKDDYSSEKILHRKDRALGYHLVTEFYDVESSLFSNTQSLYELLLKACNETKLTIIDSFKYNYAPHGTSIIIVLSESHISIHTWPEHKYMSIDLFICDKPSKAHKFIEIMNKQLKPRHTEELHLNRGILS